MDLTPFSFTSLLICLTRRSERPKAFATCFIVHSPLIHVSINVAFLNLFVLTLNIPPSYFDQFFNNYTYMVKYSLTNS